MVVGFVYVEVFELCRCWQYDVGVVGGVGEERVYYYCEQIFA